MFIGYKIINGSNLMFKSQINTKNNQGSINDFNKSISNDIQNSISVKGPTFSKLKSDGSEYTLNNIEKDDEIEYIYTIETKKNGNVRYIVSIKDNRYSISRKDLNNVTLNLIDNEKLSYEGNVLKAPLTIESKSSNDKLYYISLEYEGEKTTESKYNFEVASRYQVSIVNGGNTGGNTGDNNENTSKPGIPNIPDNTIVDGDLIYKYTKKYKYDWGEAYNWEYKTEINLDGYKEVYGERIHQSEFSDLFQINRYDEYFQASTQGSYIEINNSKVKKIKGFIIKFDDGIIIKDLKLIEKDNKGYLTESNKEYTYIMSDNKEYGQLLSGVVEIEESADIGDTYNIVIKFLY